jgi:FAD/FMN-containing dehydrogenase
LQELPTQAIQTMLDFMQTAPSQVNSVEFQALAGAVSRVAPAETAYFHREAGFNLHYKAQWAANSEEEPNIVWVEDFRRSMLKWTVGDYVNFPDTLIPNWPEAYYGGNFQRLQRVKREYDPENVFHFPQSISPG